MKRHEGDPSVPASPLHDRRFLVLWLCVAVAYLAQWMLPVVAQWFLLARAGGEAFVPFVQVALTLPVALLTIPVGVMADRVDRRQLVLFVQVAVLLVEALLVWLAYADALSPWILLALLAALACGIAGTYTPLTAMVPDLVPRESIAEASALLTIATNSTRVIGPAVAGLILVLGGVDLALAATLPATAMLLWVLARMPSRSAAEPSYERWLSAAWSGIRYVRHSPQALKLMLRSLWFTAGIMAMLSPLPVLAAQRDANAVQLGAILAAQGAGAVVGALTLPYLCRRWHSNLVVGSGFGVGAAASGLAFAAPDLAGLGAAAALAGWAWTTTLATIQGEMQLYLPAWVRARGLSVLLVSTFVGQALGASLSGWVAHAFTATNTLVLAVLILLVGAGMGWFYPLRDLRHLDRSMVQGWAGSEILVPVGEADRRLQVRVRYDIALADRTEFLALMSTLRRIRLRVGARRWHLLEDPDRSGVFYEEYLQPSGPEYAESLRTRSIASDQDVVITAAALSRIPVTVEYALRVEFHRPV